MKNIVIIFLVLLFTKGYWQDHNVCETIIISDSLCNFASANFGFETNKDGFTKSVNQSNIQNINDFVTLENTCIKFQINYGCGCVTVDLKLVSNGGIRIS